MDEFDEQRRNFLIRALTSGLFATGTYGLSLPAFSMGQIPRELPPGKSIYKLNGDVKVDSVPATLDTKITANSEIVTGKNSNIIFAVGKDAFILGGAMGWAYEEGKRKRQKRRNRYEDDIEM